MKMNMKKTVLSMVVLLLPLTVMAAGEAKNVIFFLGDGMGPVTVTASRIFKYGEDGKLNMEQLTKSARIKTFSNDAQTTDSAPSMAAYVTGVKMNNDVISMSPSTQAATSGAAYYVDGSNTTCPANNGTGVTTILELAKAAGKGTGLVTTTRVTHATPAVHYAHICARDGENNIAAQMTPGCDTNTNKCYDNMVSGGTPAFMLQYNSMLTKGSDIGIDVVLGGGLRHFISNTADGASSKRTDGVDLLAKLKTSGYTVVAPVDANGVYADANKPTAKTAFDNINTATTKKLIGLFTKSHMSWELDRRTTDEPSLAEMATKAVDILSANANGFYLMVEGGRIDHALHDTNAKRAIIDTIAFDDAIKAVMDKMQVKDPGLKNTLIIVTADHDHAIAFNGYGRRTGKTTDTEAGVLGLVKNVVSGANETAADSRVYPVLVFGNGNTAAAPEAGGSTCQAKGGNAVTGGTNSCAPVRGVARDSTLTSADTASNNYHQPVNVPFNGTNSETHGGGDVMLFATGAGSSTFKGTMENKTVFSIMRSAFGL